MKKRLLILGMIFTMAVSSAGCGSSSSSDNAGRTDKQTATVHDSQKDTSSDSKSDNDKKDTKYKSADEITMDDLMSHDETPAEDFELIDNSDEIVIQKYIGKDPIMVIPDEINGKKVVSLGTYALANDKNIVAIKTTALPGKCAISGDRSLENRGKRFHGTLPGKKYYSVYPEKKVIAKKF